MANIWREPIFDRTLNDVEFAISKISEWKKNHTHTADIRVENEKLVVEEGTAYINDDKFVMQSEGAVYVENGVLVLQIGGVYELKGCLNLLDINRIEDNISFLADSMESLGYSPNIHGKQWGIADMPTQDDMSRIIENIRALISAYYTPFNTPSLPDAMVSYSDINAIEENLHLIKQMLDCMQTSFKKVGTIKSGSKTFLPIRR